MVGRRLEIGGDGFWTAIHPTDPDIIYGEYTYLSIYRSGNGGGNVSQWIIERLDNKLLGTRFGSTSDDPGTYPDTVFHGHMVCLLSEDSASDGDIFPHMFRQAGLGPLIGKRSWGGVVGITGHGPLIDGGSVFVPRPATNDAEGNYIIEGHGVEPDIVVMNLPADVVAGRDTQLTRAIEYLQQAFDTPPAVGAQAATYLSAAQPGRYAAGVRLGDSQQVLEAEAKPGSATLGLQVEASPKCLDRASPILRLEPVPRAPID